MAAVFDSEWEVVLEQAKESKNLDGVSELLGRWRHFAYAELTDPDSYFRILATAARIQATAEPAAGSVSAEDVRALIRARLGQ
ncbi:hypothetical protein BH20ACT5_BH20ACT5_07390 [soil metagenome]